MRVASSPNNVQGPHAHVCPARWPQCEVEVKGSFSYRAPAGISHGSFPSLKFVGFVASRPPLELRTKGREALIAAVFGEANQSPQGALEVLGDER